MRKALRQLVLREDGMAMISVIAMMLLLSVLSVVLIDQVTAESNRSATAVQSDTVFQVAEAGVNDYIAKLLDDPSYYDHDVACGEATRRRSDTGVTVAAGGTWVAGIGWTYASGKNRWYSGAPTYPSATVPCTGTGTATVMTGYAYDLEISPPTSTSGRNYVTIVSTGCKLNAAGTACDASVGQRAVEVRVRRTTPADFQFMWNGAVNYGDTATTYGNIYALGMICHDGTSYGNLMSEAGVNGSGCSGYSVTYKNGAKAYTPSTNPSIRTILKSPISFSAFGVATSDVKRAAALNSPSTDFETATSNASWRIVFNSAGTMSIYLCTGSSAPEATVPTCPSTATYTMAIPLNGAVYTQQDAIISWASPAMNSIVNGRVTVASGNDIVIGGNIHYASESGGNSDDDVLGLIATNDVWIASWAPDTLWWRAASLSENGIWSSYRCKNNQSNRSSSSSMTYVGSSASYNSTGCADDYNTRIYASDDGNYNASYNALAYIFPPWYPVIDGMETTVLFHEVKPSYGAPLP